MDRLDPTYIRWFVRGAIYEIVPFATEDFISETTRIVTAYLLGTDSIGPEISTTQGDIAVEASKAFRRHV